MDSEDDMYGANDMDDCYSCSDDYDEYAYDNDSDDDASQNLISERHQKNYTVLTEDDIRKRQEDDIARISALLSIPRVSACMLLRQYKWSVTNVHDAWFSDEDRVHKAVGLVEEGAVKSDEKFDRELICGICFECYPVDEINSAANCGHPYCSTCWAAYISTSVKDGPGCLTLRCPHPSCDAAVSQDMINTLVSSEDRDKYYRYLLRSYVEDNRKIKWCPAPGCDFAVEFDLVSGSHDVSCLCSYSFCWHCTEEAHRPVDCETVSKWILKNSSESENMNWILANSKACPKCRRPIEKNHGCMHMTCGAPCKYEFCWLCLGVWSEHGERTGGFYACNQYEATKKEVLHDESEKRRDMAKNSLERYTHYYERWATNQSSRQKALADLYRMQNAHLEILSKKHKIPETQLEFLVEAWSQIVECRRVLKWTYAYGYYLPEHEVHKRQFFEYLQGEAEANLEKLHQCAEKEFYKYLIGETSEDFISFRPKVVGLTSVTRDYFENLVRALENGLSDVDSKSASSIKPSSKGVA